MQVDSERKEASPQPTAQARRARDADQALPGGQQPAGKRQRRSPEAGAGATALEDYTLKPALPNNKSASRLSQAHAAPAEEVESGKASSSREQTLQALLDHPNMPEYIRAIYTHIRAKRSGGQGWQWDTGTLLTYYKKFLEGLQGSMCGLVDPNLAQRHPNYQAEVTAAVMGQRQLRSNLDANEAVVLCGVHAAMAKHNLEQPWERVLAVHEDMLDRAALSQRACIQLANAALQQFSALEKISQQRAEAVKDLARELSQEGQLMQKEAHNWLKTQAFLTKMETLHRAETTGRFQLWQTVILSEVLDVQQCAQLQLTFDPNVYPDMPVLVRLLIKWLDPKPQQQRISENTALPGRQIKQAMLAQQQQQQQQQPQQQGGGHAMPAIHLGNYALDPPRQDQPFRGLNIPSSKALVAQHLRRRSPQEGDQASPRVQPAPVAVQANSPRAQGSSPRVGAHLQDRNTAVTVVMRNPVLQLKREVQQEAARPAQGPEGAAATPAAEVAPPPVLARPSSASDASQSSSVPSK